MSKPYINSGIDVFGASVRGPAHAEGKLPNQDAWAHGRIGCAQVVVVSDGMGSRPYAREGARAACKAVFDAARHWRRFPDASEEILLGLVHLFWRARIAPRLPEDCACTCMFAIIEPDGSGITAQLGDGLIVIRDSDGVSCLSIRSDIDFSNETCALGLSSRFSAWERLKFKKRPYALALCTDGVADDLIPEQLDKYIDWLDEDIRPHIPMKRRRMLERALREWPTPKHLDDKTVAFVYIPRE